MMKGKERCIRTGGSEANSLSISGKTLKPSPWCLFETIKRFLKKTNIIRIRRIFKTKWLLTIDCFLKRAMKKSVFYIKLMNRPRRRDGDAKDSTNSAGFDNWRESLIIIDAMLLRVTTAYPASFITCKTSIGIKFVSKTHLPETILVLEGRGTNCHVLF